MNAVNSFTARAVSLVHVWEHRSPVLLYYSCRCLRRFTRFVAKGVFVPVFTEAGDVLQNKSLKCIMNY